MSVRNKTELDLEHSIFLKRILTGASESGFIGEKYGYIDAGSVGCLSCCVLCCTPKDCCSGDKEKGKGILVLAVIAAAVAFFVALFFTVRSASIAANAQSNLTKVERKVNNLKDPIEEQPQNFQFQQNCIPPPQNFQQHYNQPPQFQMQQNLYDPNQGYQQQYLHQQDFPPQNSGNYQPYVPSHTESPSSNPSFHPNAPQLNPEENPEIQKPKVIAMNKELRTLYEAATTLLEGQHTERTIAAFYQALLTAGFGMMTAAIVIHLLLNGQGTITMALGVGGAAVTILGVLVWLKNRNRDFDDAIVAAEMIKKAIDEGVLLDIKNTY